MNPTAMKTYRLEMPSDRKRPGQSELPKNYRFTDENGDVFEIPFGTPADCRTQCRFPFEYSKAEGKWLVHKDFLTTTKTRWKQL